jgi:hypothetical protein
MYTVPLIVVLWANATLLNQTRRRNSPASWFEIECLWL